MEPQNRIPGVLAGPIMDLGQRIKMLEQTLGRLKSLDVNVHELQHIIYGYAKVIREGLVLIQDEIVIWANPAACDLFGYKLEEVVNQSSIQLVHPKYRQQLSARFAMVQAGDQIPAGTLWPVITKTREVKYVRPFSYRVMYLGKPAIMAFFYDVTEDNRLKEELAMKAEMLELAGDFIFMLDARGNIKYVNKAMCESLGYAKDEMLGRNILEFHTEEHREKVKIRLKLATATSHGIYRTDYVCKDGTLIPVSTRGKVIVMGGNEYILAVARLAEPADKPI